MIVKTIKKTETINLYAIRMHKSHDSDGYKFCDILLHTIKIKNSWGDDTISRLMASFFFNIKINWPYSKKYCHLSTVRTNAMTQGAEK